jgi:hypothetical protein
MQQLLKSDIDIEVISNPIRSEYWMELRQAPTLPNNRILSFPKMLGLCLEQVLYEAFKVMFKIWAFNMRSLAGAVAQAYNCSCLGDRNQEDRNLSLAWAKCL